MTQEELVEMGVPKIRQFVRVRGATKTEIGRLNVPVAMGGNFIILPRRRRDGCRWFIIP